MCVICDVGCVGGVYVCVLCVYMCMWCIVWSMCVVCVCCVYLGYMSVVCVCTYGINVCGMYMGVCSTEKQITGTD